MSRHLLSLSLSDLRSIALSGCVCPNIWLSDVTPPHVIGGCRR